MGERVHDPEPLLWDPIGMKYNFYETYTPTGVTGVAAGKRVIYESVYDSIDYHVLSNKSGPKFLIVIRPGGDPSDIMLKFEGQDSIKVDVDGALKLIKGTSFIKLREGLAYQQVGNTIVPISWTPEYEHYGTSLLVTLSLGEYDPTLPLILQITPEVPPAPPPPPPYTVLPEWCTNLAGTGGNDMVSGLDHDADRNVYYTGHSNSTGGLPVTTGLITQTAGNYDFIIGRFNEHYEMEVDGTWLTYMGGANDDRGFSVAYDGTTDRVAVCGQAYSNTASLVQYTGDQYHSSGWGAIALFDAASGVREYATQLKFTFQYFGDPTDLDFDAAGNLYVVGGGNILYADYVDPAGSLDYTAHQGAYDPQWLGFDAFVARFDPGMHLTWFTALGGPIEDRATAVVVDKTHGKLYVGGRTNTPNNLNTANCPATGAFDFPLCPGTGWFQNTLNGNTNALEWGNDGFITCFSLFDLGMEWSTYFGSPADAESITDLAVNGLGDLYAVGYSNMADLSTSNCAWDGGFYFPRCQANGGYNDLSNDGWASGHFISRFNIQHDLTWSTFLSGDYSEYSIQYGELNMPHVVCDGANNVFVHGSTRSGAINSGGGTHVVPMTSNAAYYNESNHKDAQVGWSPAPLFDDYVVGFTAACQIIYATMVGGIGQDFAGGIDVFSDRLYICGATGANLQFPLHCPTLPGYQPYCANPTPVVGDHDGFIAQLQYSYTVGLTEASMDQDEPLRLYPNPVSQELTVQFGEWKADQVLIVDATGRTIQQLPVQGRSSMNIQASGLAPGSYALRVSDDRGVRSAWFIKQ